MSPLGFLRELVKCLTYFASFYLTSGWSIWTIAYIAGAVVILTPVVWDLLQLTVWHRAELYVPNRPILLGERTVVSYRRRPRRPGPAPTPGIVEARLVCREATPGSKGRFVSRTVLNVPMRVPGTATPWGFMAGLPLEIPLDAGGPTLDTDRAHVYWLLIVRVRMTRWLPASTPTYFPLEVEATLAPDCAALTEPTHGDPEAAITWEQRGSPTAGSDSESAMAVILADPIVERGGTVRLSLSYNPTLDTSPVTAVDIDLNAETHVPVEQPLLTTVFHETVPLEARGISNLTKEYLLPEGGPISYEGTNIQVRWRLHVVAHRPPETPHVIEFDIDVVPAGGRGLYHEPHPHRWR